MELTPEIIKAVEEYQKAEQQRQAEEALRECQRRAQESWLRRRAGAMAQARTIIPELTEEQFGTLHEVFSDYGESPYDNEM